MLYGTVDTQQQQQIGDEEAEQQEYDNTYHHHHVADYSIPRAYTQTPPIQLVQPPEGMCVINSTLVNYLLEIFHRGSPDILVFLGQICSYIVGIKETGH